MAGVTEQMLAEWRSAIGRTQQRHEQLDPESLRRFALAIGASSDVEQHPPVLAHWAFFLPRAGADDLDADGAARDDLFAPPPSLPRRMFAGTDIAFHAPLRLGEPAEQVTTLADIAHKRGRSGDLLFVEVERAIVQQGSARIRERRRSVYRAEEAKSARAEMPHPSRDPIAGELWEPVAIDLFRFSAATFSAHRIHYDQPYATQVEGYPALVVHGPFTAAKLAELAARRGRLARFAFRAQAPLYLGQPIRLQLDGDEARALRCDGTTAMTAALDYA